MGASVSRRHKIVIGAAALQVLILMICAPRMVRVARAGLEFSAIFGQYASSIRVGDFERAYKMTSSDFRQVTDYAEFVRLYQSFSAKLGKLRSIERGPMRLEAPGSSAYVYAAADASFHYDRGDVVFRFWFKKSSGVWQLVATEEQ